MLLGGYLGETGVWSPTVGFVVEWLVGSSSSTTFVGEGAQIKDSAGNENLVMAFDGIKWIVTIGWQFTQLVTSYIRWRSRLCWSEYSL